MRKTTLKIAPATIDGQRFWRVEVPKVGGGRIRRHFKDKMEAKAFLETAKVQKENHGTASLGMDERLRVEAVEGARRLQAFDKSLTDAVNFYLAHLKTVEGSKPTSDVVREFMSAREKDGMSQRYLGDLRVRLARFALAFGSDPLAGITAQEIDAWLRSLSVGAVTRNTFRRRLSALFEFGRKRGYLKESPLRDVEKARERQGETSYLTVPQASKLLEVAAHEMVPYWAIALFAGLRRAEIEESLDWQNVDFESSVITVPSERKTGRRVVPMSDNLKAWLLPYASCKGRVCPSAFRDKFDADREKAGLLKSWEENVCRHSFGSYRLAECGDKGRVATEMGNTPAIVDKHYKALVKPREAKAFWSICPAAPSNLIKITA